MKRVVLAAGMAAVAVGVSAATLQTEDIHMRDHGRSRPPLVWSDEFNGLQLDTNV